MNSLRKISSLLRLGRKQDSISTEILDPILEDSSEEETWPAYNPSVYESIEEPQKIGQHSRHNEQAEPKPTRAHNILPGTPPQIFKEGDRLYNLDRGIIASLDHLNWEEIYGDAKFSHFGPQYGLSKSARTSSQDFVIQSPTVFRVESSNFYENMMRSADADLQRAFLESLKSTEGQGSRGDRESAGKEFVASSIPRPTPSTTSPRGVREEILASTESFVQSTTSPTSCIICTEDFTDKIRPPGWISLACLHEPSVCTDCISKSIKSDLESKIWNQIKCPECSTLLVYEDIKRLADSKTFSRYEVMSFRSAVSGDNNFIWCQKCDFGQLHESGASKPIVRCLKCGFQSCFVHSVAWHERLTCQEYDEMLQDPDGFQSAIDREDEANKEARRIQLEQDERLAHELSQRDKQAEELRQRQRHEEEMRKARARQAAEAERKKQEQERAKKREEIKRKQMEDQLSMAKVQSTTKKCPGCQWPIEKNEGCDHMTCIKCRHEFCWRCMKNWKTHGGICRY